MSILRFTTLILCFFAVTGCEKFPSPPESVAFDISTKGAEAILNFTITEEKQYPFLLRFNWDPNDKTRIKYLEADIKKSKSNLINIKLVRYSGDSQRSIVIDKKFVKHTKQSHNYSAGIETFLITRIKLSPGNYSAVITSLDDIAIHKKKNIKTTFLIAQPRAK